jgi:glucose-6-phosphate 1-dehydrogenase
VQITVAESVDVGQRAGYYDSSGVLRDMFQNHLMQLLTLIAMEPPASFNADDLRNEKFKVLKSIQPVSNGDVVLGQYDGYQATKGVESDSRTPTFASLKLEISNWRWQGVPFYLRSGKNLTTKLSEIFIEFKCPPLRLFDLPDERRFASNYISICIQPDEGIHLGFEIKVLDSSRETSSVDMNFHYRDNFEGVPLPEAYERLILDAIKGDASLFARSDEIEQSWRLIDPIIQAGEDGTIGIGAYRPGSWGPERSLQLLDRDQRRWQSGCLHN